MNFLARFRILTKILAIVIFMAGLASAIAYVGTSSLQSLNDNAGKMTEASKRELLAARANQNVIALNRAEFRSALDPRTENRAAARKIIDDNLKLIEERIAELAKTPDDRARALMPDVTVAYAAYRRTWKIRLGRSTARQTSS